MCPPGRHHNGFVATHALGNMMYGIFDIYTLRILCMESCIGIVPRKSEVLQNSVPIIMIFLLFCAVPI